MQPANGLAAVFIRGNRLQFGGDEMTVSDCRHHQTQRYRILSLDGGGVKGAYTASVLATLESLTGKSIGQHFDLITGTSTGGIIAIAIGLGIPLARIRELYVNKGPVIFPCTTRGWFGKAA